LNIIPCLTAAFASCGFLLYDLDNSEGDIIYRGNIETKQFGNLIIEYVFEKGYFIDFPTAYIASESKDKIIPYHFPHLNHMWEICYHDKSKIFDIYCPDTIVLFCIESVKSVLDNNTYDDMEEIIPEFESYWFNNYKQFFGTLADTDDYSYVCNNWFRGKQNLLKINLDSCEKVPIFKFETIPSISGVDWPIENYEDLKKWLDRDNSAVVNDMEKYIKNCLGQYKFELLMLIHMANIYIGLTITFFDPIVRKRKNNLLRSETVNLVMKRRHEIKRFTIDNYDSTKLIKSNDRENDVDLIDKKILLIGAGTIGSNLANILVRNGAGIGSGGCLTIVDKDIMNPYNLSRHFLGISHSGKEKTIALQEELNSIIPFATIIPQFKKAQELDLRQYDIIIDSSGEEGLTIWLNENIKKLSNDLLFLSIWIKGQGESVECFSMSNTQGACHECYRRSPFYLPSIADQLPLRNSCMSVYVPFPITASLYASLLAVHVLHNRLSNSMYPSSLCCQKINPPQSIEEKIIKFYSECPVCGKHYIKG
jgi:molybdopterin/thiamine biosynthesis adenylyltransferase